eukprot:954796-Rhodomonas_salina.1
MLEQSGPTLPPDRTLAGVVPQDVCSRPQHQHRGAGSESSGAQHPPHRQQHRLPRRLAQRPRYSAARGSRKAWLASPTARTSPSRVSCARAPFAHSSSLRSSAGRVIRGP